MVIFLRIIQEIFITEIKIMTFLDQLGSLYHAVLGSNQKKYPMYELGIAALVALFLGGGYFGFTLYIDSREQQAHKFFADSMDYYGKMLQEKDQNWKDVADSFSIGYESNSSSYLAPYFLLMQADALLRDNRFDDGVMVMEKGLASLDKGSPLYFLYTTKMALIYCDASDSTVAQKGLDELVALAHNEGNIHREVAQYYAGYYYFAHKDTQRAAEEWKPLVELQKLDSIAVSPWAQKASEQLATIS